MSNEVLKIVSAAARFSQCAHEQRADDYRKLRPLPDCEDMATAKVLLYGITTRIEYSSNRGNVTVARPLAHDTSNDLPSGCIMIDFGA